MLDKGKEKRGKRGGGKGSRRMLTEKEGREIRWVEEEEERKKEKRMFLFFAHIVRGEGKKNHTSQDDEKWKKNNNRKREGIFHLSISPLFYIFCMQQREHFLHYIPTNGNQSKKKEISFSIYPSSFFFSGQQTSKAIPTSHMLT